MANRVFRVGGVTDHLHFRTGYFASDDRTAFPAMVTIGVPAFVDFRNRHRIGDVPTLGVSALFTEELEGVDDRLA